MQFRQTGVSTPVAQVRCAVSVIRPLGRAIPWAIPLEAEALLRLVWSCVNASAKTGAGLPLSKREPWGAG